jgi:tight adherence protein B
LVFPAAALLTWGVVGLVTRERRPRLDHALAPYMLKRLTPVDALVAQSGKTELVETPFVKRAVAAVAEFAVRRGLMPLLEGRLDEADIPVRPAEALFFWAVAVVIATVLGLVLGGLLIGVLALAASVLVPWFSLGIVAARRRRTFADQLPDMLQLLSTTLRSGFAVLQGLDTVARQLSGPLGKEMRGVVAEARLGRSIVTSLTEVARRVKNEDLEWVATAIGIQQEVGGNLAELLDIVAETMNARSRLRREAHALTAEGRIGAIIISVMPVAIGLFVYLVNPSYVSPLFHTTLGEILLYGSMAMAVAGIFWLRRIVEFEV